MLTPRLGRIGLAVLTSVAGAALMGAVTERMSPLAFAGWAAFFLALQSAAVFPGLATGCEGWSRRLWRAVWG